LNPAFKIGFWVRLLYITTVSEKGYALASPAESSARQEGKLDFPWKSLAQAPLPLCP
jgi:hypothetical protein